MTFNLNFKSTVIRNLTLEIRFLALTLSPAIVSLWNFGCAWNSVWVSVLICETGIVIIPELWASNKYMSMWHRLAWYSPTLFFLQRLWRMSHLPCSLWFRLEQHHYAPARGVWFKMTYAPSILKEISHEYSLEGLMLKLKLQYFGHLMQRTDSLKKTLMLGKIEGRRRRGWQRMSWLDGITDSMDEFE